MDESYSESLVRTKELLWGKGNIDLFQSQAEMNTGERKETAPHLPLYLSISPSLCLRVTDKEPY